MAAPNRQDLHQAIDQLTDAQLATVAQTIEELHARENGSSSSEARTASEQTAFRSMLDRWAQTASLNQELREATFSRELIYGDHNEVTRAVFRRR